MTRREHQDPSSEQGAPELRGHQGRLMTHDNAGVPEHHRAGDHHLVLPELVVVPAPWRQVQRTVDFGGNGPPTRAAPLGVEIAAPATLLGSNGLAGRLGQAEAVAQLAEVDLAQRFGALSDVGDGAEQCLAMSRTQCIVDSGAEVNRPNEALLYGGGEQAAA